MDLGPLDALPAGPHLISPSGPKENLHAAIGFATGPLNARPAAPGAPFAPPATSARFLNPSARGRVRRRPLAPAPFAPAPPARESPKTAGI